MCSDTIKTCLNISRAVDMVSMILHSTEVKTDNARSQELKTISVTFYPSIIATLFGTIIQ